MSTFTIARLTFREASRRWVLWVALLLGVIFLVVYGLAYNSMQEDLQNNASRINQLMFSELYHFFLMAGLYVVNFLCVLMTVLTSVDTLSGEIASGTIHTIVSKPVRRWEVVAGKWLGYAGMLSLYLLLMAGVMAIIYLTSGYVAPNALRHGADLVEYPPAARFLLGGSMLSTLTNGVLVFGLYGVAFIGGGSSSLPG
jgi:ABC-type transport system involved in multi-copper enzyme maturation permease subunit